MDDLTKLLQEHYASSFQTHGATPQGVDGHNEEEQEFRYDKMLAVMDHDFARPSSVPSMLDVGCGWGGLFQHSKNRGKKLNYTGIDLVEPMIESGSKLFPDAQFKQGDVLALEEPGAYDYVVCNGVLMKKLTARLPDMEKFTHRLVRKMFDLCRFGVGFNVLSTRVNFTGDHLYYQNPMELLAFCLTEVTPRVKLDHAYSSLGSGRGRYYDYTVYLYKD